MTLLVELGPDFIPPTTVEELMCLPDCVYGELIAGVFVRTPAHSAVQGVVSSRLGYLVGSHVDRHALGIPLATGTPFHLRRAPDTVRCPDFAFVAAERLTAGIPLGAFEDAPDLAVEVLSPSNTHSEMSRKLAEYLRYGSRQVWIVDPESRTVTTHTAGGLPRFLEGDDVLDGGALLPGFTVPLARISRPHRRRPSPPRRRPDAAAGR